MGRIWEPTFSTRPRYEFMSSEKEIINGGNEVITPAGYEMEVRYVYTC